MKSAIRPVQARLCRANEGVKMIGSQLFAWAIAVVVAVGQVVTLVEPASAGAVSVPAPIVGAGLPGLAIMGGVYGAIWLTRKMRSRRQTR
jgi:hypothetical protein